MHFFSYISNSYACKNKLEKEILAFLKTQERLVISANELDSFKANILSSIADCNDNNNRCNPIKAYWWVGHKEKDYHLSMGGGVANFHLYESIN
jgi:signal recognition particle receptor subunit beta